MSSNVPLPPSSPSSDPALLQATEAITGTHDAKAASGIDDMLLIFLSAAGTILGALLVAMVYGGQYPGLASWERFSRPYGTGLAPNLYPALRAGLSSAVPAGLIPIPFEGWFVFSGCPT